MERIKRITSHAGYARWLSETSEEPIGAIHRTEIPSPYAYSQLHQVYLWGDRRVISVETAHKRYDVFALPADMQLLPKCEECDGRGEISRHTGDVDFDTCPKCHGDRVVL